jgi:hypothetical protein
MSTTLEQAQETRQPNQLGAALKPLVIELGVPVGSYYLLHDGLGLSVIASLALSSVVPGVRTVVGVVRERSFNGLAGLMVAVNLVGIAAGLIVGDPRLMIAKDRAISSVIGIGILVSVFMGRPLMSKGLKPFLTKGNAAKTQSWDRLTATSVRFRRLEAIYSAVWGTALLGECLARIVLAYTLPVTTMAWLSGALVAGAIGLAIIGGIPETAAMERLIEQEN